MERVECFERFFEVCKVERFSLKNNHFELLMPDFNANETVTIGVCFHISGVCVQHNEKCVEQLKLLIKREESFCDTDV